MARLRPVSVVLLVLLALAEARAEEGDVQPPELRLVPIREGLLRAVVRGDLSRLPDSSIQKQAARVGLDLARPPRSHVVHRMANGRLFYVFYKVGENALGDRPYVIQRIKRTERNWESPDDTEPTLKVTYQVEVFKLKDGALKRPDQHYGSYGIGTRHRREIVKEYEIGFGTIPGVCEGKTWPFDPGILFKYLYRYGPSSEVYDAVEWIAATPWTLDVSLDAEGSYRVAAPALGFDVPDAPPPQEGLVIEAGRAPDGLVFGASTAEDLHAARGEPTRIDDLAVGESHVYDDGLAFDFNGPGRLETVSTRPGFAGRTTRGLRHGDTRGRVIDTLGIPLANAEAGAPFWAYEGIGFSFDDDHRVARIVLTAP